MPWNVWAPRMSLIKTSLKNPTAKERASSACTVGFSGLLFTTCMCPWDREVSFVTLQKHRLGMHLPAACHQAVAAAPWQHARQQSRMASPCSVLRKGIQNGLGWKGLVQWFQWDRAEGSRRSRDWEQQQCVARQLASRLCVTLGCNTHCLCYEGVMQEWRV